MNLTKKDVELLNEIKELIKNKGYFLEEFRIGTMYNGTDDITIRIKRSEDLKEKQ